MKTRKPRGEKARHQLDHGPVLVPPGKKLRLKDRDPAYAAGFDTKAEAKEALLEDVSGLAQAQELLWASKAYAVIIIFQAMDAAGKDSTIKHVMSGVNPQGCQVFSFKAALRRGARPQLPLALQPGACPSAAGSASSTAPTTRKSWWSGSIPKCSSQQQLPHAARSATKSSGRRATRTSTPSSGTWSATAR